MPTIRDTFNDTIQVEALMGRVYVTITERADNKDTRGEVELNLTQAAALSAALDDAIAKAAHA